MIDRVIAIQEMNLLIRAILSFNRAMAGEIADNICAITFEFDFEKKIIKNYFYYYKNIIFSDEDFDSASTMDGEVIGDFFPEFKSEFKIISIDKNIKELDGIPVYWINNLNLESIYIEKIYKTYFGIIKYLSVHKTNEFRALGIITTVLLLMGNVSSELLEVILEINNYTKTIDILLSTKSEVLYSREYERMKSLLERVVTDNIEINLKLSYFTPNNNLEKLLVYHKNNKK